MKDYEQLVEALRCCDEYALRNDCPILETCDCDVDKAMAIAAAVIEALEAEVDFYKKRLQEWCGVCPDDGHCDNCEIAGHGHWIPQVTEDGGHNDLLDCSMCGESIWNTQKNKKFCPNCGAKMEEVQE